MKKVKYIFLVIIVVLSISSFAQMTAPNDPGGNPEADEDPIGGGAPIGGGTLVLLGLATSYAIRKVFYLSGENELEE